MLGPYIAKDGKIEYPGGRDKLTYEDVVGVASPESLLRRHLSIKEEASLWAAKIRIWDSVFKATNKFMEKNRVMLFDLPITTRMISSPGALTGTIPSDVDSFEINFFDEKKFLTQSSQLYLEFAITNPEVDKVYCWEKSFRMEPANFRHLPEFTHVEFEGNIGFQENLKIQKDYLQYITKYIIDNNKHDLEVFLHEDEIRELYELTKINDIQRITFHEAFKLLREHTGDKKYDDPTIKPFGAYEEILLTQIMQGPVFVTNYISNEVAFYHANDPADNRLAKNADLLFPGYGELIGSGERVNTREETRKKAEHFQLDIQDYKPYIESRDDKNPIVHSGWGMGIERFVQSILKLPFIWDAKAFPRVSAGDQL